MADTTTTDYTRTGEPIACRHSWHYGSDGLPLCKGAACDGRTVACGQGLVVCQRHTGTSWRPTTRPSCTHHRTINTSSWSRVYADGYSNPGRRAAHVSLTIRSHGDVVGTSLTPAEARELAQQLLASAAFVDDAVAVAL